MPVGTDHAFGNHRCPSRVQYPATRSVVCAHVAQAASVRTLVSANECRGSVLMVTGIECGVVAPIVCTAFDHRAASRAEGTVCTLTWLISFSVTRQEAIEAKRAIVDFGSAPF